MITADDYRASLRDGRAVWLEGKRVADVTADPLLAKSVDWVASTYERYVGARNPVFDMPTTREELRGQFRFLLASDRTATTTAACMALTALGDEALSAFAGAVAQADLRLAAAVDDTAKPLTVIAEDSHGVVVRGGKQHVVGAAVVHELVALAGDVAVAVPVASPGVRVIAHTPAPRPGDDRSYPYSRRRSASEALVVFDEVFVPAERVFVDGRRYHEVLDVWERGRAVAEQADRAELIMGLAQTIADMNGIGSVPHIRDKLAAIAVYATMCRAGWEAALSHAGVAEGGIIRPDDAYLQAAKSYGGQLYSDMTHYLHDIAGGAVITAPAIADMENPDTGEYLRKYMGTMKGVPGEDRVRIFHLIRDLFADTYGGWDKVTNQVVGGGMHAQRMAALGSYDLVPAVRRAREAAGIR